MRLTDESIRTAKRPKGGQAFAWDELVSGFGVRYTPTKTCFVVQWRGTDKLKHRKSLLPHWPRLSTASARDMARQHLGKELGTKEADGQQQLRHAMRSWFERQTTLGAWRPRYRQKVDWLIRVYVEGEARERSPLSATALHAVAQLGAKGVAAVTRTDMLSVVDAIKPGVAEQFMAILSSFYNAMYERDIVTGNPARNRLRVTGGRNVRKRSLSDAEFLLLWRAFEAERDPNFAAFAMLAYTGTRRREVTQMRHAEIDIEARTWTLPPERRKTGRTDPEPFVIALHPGAVDILARQPQLEGSPYVFWGRRDKRPFDFQHLLIKRIRDAVPVKDWRLHDIRRFVRSGMARLHVSQMVAELCLGHIAKSGLVGVYDQHSYAAEKTAAWLAWGDYLARLTAR